MAVLKFRSKLLENRRLNDECIQLSFSNPDSFLFKAGQFVNILTYRNGIKKWTAYSILSPPYQKTRFDLCFNVVPNGFCTPILAGSKVGDEFEFKGPFGMFIFDEENMNKEHWFLGTGTGVVPLYCMIKEYKDKLRDHKFKLFFGVKTFKDLLYHDEFQSWDNKNDNFEYVPICSREEWEGKKGHVQDHIGDNLENKDFYICGLKEMVVDCIGYLEKNGISKKDIKSERYT